MNQQTPLLSDLLPEDKLAQEIGVSKATLVSWRQKQIGPAYTKLGKRVFYQRAAIQQWIGASERPMPREGGRRRARGRS
jgi:predicted DNA-binding transcriptional regulator AlpA